MEDAASLRASNRANHPRAPEKEKEVSDQPRNRESRKKNQEERRSRKKRYENYAPLNSPFSRNLEEKETTDLRDRPPPLPTKGDKLDSKRFCEFHNGLGPTTDECLNLKDKVEELICAGRLSKYVVLSSGDLPRPRSPRFRRTPTRPRYRGRSLTGRIPRHDQP